MKMTKDCQAKGEQTPKTLVNQSEQKSKQKQTERSGHWSAINQPSNPNTFATKSKQML